MKFTVNTMDFKEALTKVSKVIVPSKYMSIIENVKVEVKGDKCYLRATNLENFVTTEIDLIHSDADGEFVFMETKTLLKAIKFFKDFETTIELLDSNKVNLICGGKKATQMVYDKEEIYPETPEMDMENVNEYKYNVKKLKERFNLVKYACSKTETRPILTGIHFNNEDIVSCDGFRLAINKDYDLNVGTPFTVTQNAMKLTGEVLEGDTNITVNHKLIKIEDGKTVIVSRLLDGEYIDYKSVVPQDGSKVTVGIKSFNESLKYLKTFYTDKGSKTNPSVWNNNKLVFKSLTGVYESEVDIKGEFDYKIAFNMDFMTDALSQFKADEVSVRMDGSIKPMVLETEDGENLALVLPVRLPEEHNNEEVA